MFVIHGLVPFYCFYDIRAHGLVSRPHNRNLSPKGKHQKTVSKRHRREDWDGGGMVTAL
jgi:hypothetical protein